MPKLKANTILPTPSEDAQITAAALADPEARPFSDEEWNQAQPYLRQGYPPATERITIHLSRDVIEQFRATGTDWQLRIDEALREWLVSHSPKPTSSILDN